MLEAALRRVIRRHEVLRTWFFKAPGMALPLQVVQEEDSALRLERVGLEAYDVDGVEGRLGALFRSLGRSPEGAEGDAGIWAALATLSRERHLLLLDLPALCADAATL